LSESQLFGALALACFTFCALAVTGWLAFDRDDEPWEEADEPQ
jgi:hypothetical protein